MLHRREAEPAQPRPARQGPPFWLAVPALAFFGLFALLPLGGVAVLSFMEWDGLGTPRWAGAEIWLDTLADPATRAALWRTVVFVVVSFLFQAPVALLLGVFTAGRQRYRAAFAVLYFLPLLFSSAAIGIVFRSLLDPNFGLSRAFSPGTLSTNWLGDPDLALYAVIFVVGWAFVPFHALLYQAGVRQIPASLYEAATLDGAGRWQQFRYVTLPQLRYTIVTSSTLMLVGSLTYFDLVFVLTGGGPGDATRILPLDMYLTGFRSYQMGPASVIAVLLVAIGLALSLFLSRVSGSGRMQSQQAGAA
ncbi:carbohydrate ABC transporter permease [Jiangella anatolica]|uniref:ABC transporter n=1 Tax=Jiangella anatolica TaxID=2670374 RepID=A0A2W2CM89_9ACTN|nr:sugar ABC transporter permease [Jiangella anatolica]PZF81313.1 ABC transporter [Jiangella anatolica]